MVQAVLKGGQVDGEKSSQKVDWFAGRSDLGTIAPRFAWVCFSPHTPKKMKKGNKLNLSKQYTLSSDRLFNQHSRNMIEHSKKNTHDWNI